MATKRSSDEMRTAGDDEPKGTPNLEPYFRDRMKKVEERRVKSSRTVSGGGGGNGFPFSFRRFYMPKD